jgi:hypothetical protein
MEIVLSIIFGATAAYSGFSLAEIISEKFGKRVLGALVGTLVIGMVVASVAFLSVISSRDGAKDFHRGRYEVYYHSTNGVVTDTTYRLK